MIVFLHGAPAFGAVEAYVGELLRELRTQGRRAVLVHPDVAALAPLVEAAPEHVALPLELITGSAFKLVNRLVRELRGLGPDVVHVTDLWPAAVIAARIARVPRVLVTHHTPELPRNDNVAGRALNRLAWALGPQVIYTSESDRANDGRSGPTHVVYYGIDLARWSEATRALEHVGPVIGTVGRLAEQKGQSLIVDAAPRILEGHPDALFVIVGEGEGRAELEALIGERGLGDSFRLVGHRDDVERYVASFDVFVLPSYFEGLCYAVIEAQAAGIPVVATPVGGVPENVRDGETGVRMTIGDSDSLADGVLSLLRDPERAAALAAEAQRRVFSRYGLATMLEETVALYG